MWLVRTILLTVIASPLIACSSERKPQSMNQHEFDIRGGEPISFLMAGHVYGGQKPKNTDIAYSLGKSVNLLNALKPEYMMFLGDIVQETTPSDIENLKSFVAQLQFPVFNAPGNHELVNPENYKVEFGPTYFHFTYDSSLFLGVDSQQYRHRKAKNQHIFITSQIENFRLSSSLKNLFIFSHHLIWAPGNNHFDEVTSFTNAPYHHDNEFLVWAEEIIPSLRKLTRDKHVYFVSGDIGLSRSIPYFYEKDESGRITYIATGLGDTSEDAILRCSIEEGNVSFHIVPLINQNLEFYGRQYWSNIFNSNVQINAQ